MPPWPALITVAKQPQLAGTGLVAPSPGAREEIHPVASRRGYGRAVLQSVRRPGVLLDRDGTIIVDHGYVGSVDRVQLIAGAAEAIALLNRAKVPVAVVTNQAGVARGLYDIIDVETVNRHLSSLLAEHGAHIDRFFYCPYHPDGTVEAFARASADRKPMPGMAQAAAQALNLDLTASWVVGDREEDVGLAKAIGASAIYLGPDTCERRAVWTVPSLLAAVDIILGRIAV